MVMFSWSVTVTRLIVNCPCVASVCSTYPPTLASAGIFLIVTDD